MACCMPLKSSNLNVNILVLEPTVVVDQLVEALKHFTSWSVTFGCIHSSILQSIHGNMIIWYGAWMKRSDDNQKLLDSALLFMLAKISSMADIVANNFFQAYGGESKNGFLAARFSTGDTVSLSDMAYSSPNNASELDLPNTILATFQSRFLTMDGATSGVCLKKYYNYTDSRANDSVLNFCVWESLEYCYSYIMRSDIKYEGLSVHLKHYISRVIYVSGEDVLNFQHSPWPPHFILAANRDENYIQANEMM
ncbi:Serine incorporator 4 [Heracleum sosnowskyi]|uniref:Serine incorporator 4 n=1 Tax=Heracleum sosnowskyi TaxID=360622 RepID=A0AAD8MGU9_9APIA|nr:Serine incorporator 4 [Heracleum sosnowskyi]